MKAYLHKIFFSAFRYRVAFITACSIFFLLQLNAYPSPDFDIDLNDLKKPSIKTLPASKVPKKDLKPQIQHLPPATKQAVKNQTGKIIKKSASIQKQAVTVKQPPVIVKKQMPTHMPVSIDTGKTSTANYSNRDELFIHSFSGYKKFISDPIDLNTLLEVCVVSKRNTRQTDIKPEQPENISSAKTTNVIDINRSKDNYSTPHQKQKPEASGLTVEAESTCSLGYELLKRISSTSEPEKLNRSFDRLQHVLTAATYDNVTALLACSLTRAEEYTLRRLLDINGIKLISISNDDSIQAAIESITEVFGVSYMSVPGVENTFIFRNQNGQELLIRFKTKLSGKPEKQTGLDKVSHLIK